jgi:truncated hemoglobin YjbI
MKRFSILSLCAFASLLLSMQSLEAAPKSQQEKIKNAMSGGPEGDFQGRDHPRLPSQRGRRDAGPAPRHQWVDLLAG